MHDDVVWVSTTRDMDTDGQVEVDDVGGARRVVDSVAPYGHGGRAPAGTALAIVRRTDGGIAVACESPAPSSPVESGGTWMLASSGDGVVVDPAAASGCRVAVRTGTGGCWLGSDGSGLMAIARDLDNIKVDPAWSAWFTVVGVAIGSPPPLASPIGQVIATSKHKAST